MASVCFTFLFYLTVLRSDVKVIKTKSFVVVRFLTLDLRFSSMLCGFSPGIGDASPASGVSCGCLQCGFLQSAPESAESFTVCFEYAHCTGAIICDYYDIDLLLPQVLRIKRPMI